MSLTALEGELALLRAIVRVVEHHVRLALGGSLALRCLTLGNLALGNLALGHLAWNSCKEIANTVVDFGYLFLFLLFCFFWRNWILELRDFRFGNFRFRNSDFNSLLNSFILFAFKIFICKVYRNIVNIYWFFILDYRALNRRKSFFLFLHWPILEGGIWLINGFLCLLLILCLGNPRRFNFYFLRNLIDHWGFLRSQLRLKK